MKKFAGKDKIEGAALCSVVPRATPFVGKFITRLGARCFELNTETIRGMGIDYPKPNTIGPDRLANAVAAHISSARRWSSWISGRQ